MNNRMNYAAGILAYLSQCAECCEVILVPGAPPMHRMENGLRAIDPAVMTPDDLRETLSTLRGYVPGSKMTSEKDGAFSFGIPQRGRFRVTYVTQRGSMAARVVKIPGSVPLFTSLLEDAGMAERCLAQLATFRQGVLLVAATPLSVANTFTYSLLDRVIARDQRLVATVEQGTTFLLKHGKSLVMQCEYGPYDETLKQSIRSCMAMGPDLIYVHDLGGREDLEAVQQASRSHILVVVSIPEIEVARLTAGEWVADRGLFCGVWRVKEAQSGRMTVEM